MKKRDNIFEKVSKYQLKILKDDLGNLEDSKLDNLNNNILDQQTEFIEGFNKYIKKYLKVYRECCNKNGKFGLLTSR